MIEIITDSGISLDLVPDQDITMTIENPLLSADRIPVAWTTDFELAPSQKNFSLFKFVPGLYVIPNITSVNASISINSIPIVSGKLEFTSFTASSFSVSFAGVSIEDSLKGTLNEAPMEKWNFGTMVASADIQRYNDVIGKARLNERSEFTLPTLVRESLVDEPDYSSPKEPEQTQLKWATKYANNLQGYYVIPVLRLKYILATVFSDCNIDSDYNELISNIGIVAPYRKNGSVDDYEHGGLDKDDYGNYELDLASGLPSVPVVDFVKDILSTVCATIFVSSQGKAMISNKSIMRSTEFVDWTSKVADEWSVTWEDGMDYEYGYSSIPEPKEIVGEIVDCRTINGCFNAAEGATVRHTPTQDIYSVLYVNTTIAEIRGDTWTGLKPVLSVVEQGKMFTPTAPENSQRDVYSAKSGLIPVKTKPQMYYKYRGNEMWWNYAYVAPIVSFPKTGGDRSTDVYFGISYYDDTGSMNFASSSILSSNGVYGKGEDGWEENALSVKMQEDDGIYNLFHKEFAEWLNKDKSPYSVPLNLNAFDIQGLQLWRKVMLKHQLFYIKTLSISINTSSSIIETEGEFVKA